jgi:hypothetical protein
MNNKLESSDYSLRYYSHICLGGLRKTMKKNSVRWPVSQVRFEPHTSQVTAMATCSLLPIGVTYMRLHVLMAVKIHLSHSSVTSQKTTQHKASTP